MANLSEYFHFRARGPVSRRLRETLISVLRESFAGKWCFVARASEADIRRRGCERGSLTRAVRQRSIAFSKTRTDCAVCCRKCAFSVTFRPPRVLVVALASLASPQQRKMDTDVPGSDGSCDHAVLPGGAR